MGNVVGERHSRQVAFFGAEGQKAIQRIKAVIVGVGGIGSHVAQQLAFLGVRSITLIDDDTLDESNLNRLIGARSDDPMGMKKVDIVERHILSIDPRVKVSKVDESFISRNGYGAAKEATVVFGCVDLDGPRLVLNEFCLAYELLYVDVASDIMPDGAEYGGRVVAIFDANGCLYCWGEIDSTQAGVDLETQEARKDRESIYGVPVSALGSTGPSVVSINGVVASLAVTEFMLHFTKVRDARKYLAYYGTRGIVSNRPDPPDSASCYYCTHVRRQGDRAALNRYLP